MKPAFFIATAVYLFTAPVLAGEGQATRDLNWCYSAFPRFSQRDLQEACILKAVKDAAGRGQAKGDERATWEKEHPRPHRERDVDEIVSDWEEFEAELRARRAVNDVFLRTRANHLDTFSDA